MKKATTKWGGRVSTGGDKEQGDSRWLNETERGQRGKRLKWMWDTKGTGKKHKREREREIVVE